MFSFDSIMFLNYCWLKINQFGITNNELFEHITHFFWFDVKFEHYNKALNLYFIPPFEQCTACFFSENKQDFSLMLTLYGINDYFYILWSRFSKMVLTTEEVITAHWKLSQ